MVVFPAFTPVITPLLDTLAIWAFLDVNVYVCFAFLPVMEIFFFPLTKIETFFVFNFVLLAASLVAPVASVVRTRAPASITAMVFLSFISLNPPCQLVYTTVLL